MVCIILVKAETRYFVDVVSLVAFIINAASGFILWFGVPNGRSAGQRLFLSISRQNWIALHNFTGFIFIIAIAIHFIINFRWLVRMTKKILHISS